MKPSYVIIFVFLLLSFADLLMAQEFATITTSNCRSQANGNEWVLDLKARLWEEPKVEIKQEAGWTYDWYNNYNGTWVYKRTTSYPINYTTMDGLCGRYYDAKVVIHANGLNVTSEIKHLFCPAGDCYK